MNIILEGPDATGKTTLAQKLKNKYGMKIINSTGKTRNDLHYHIDLLDYQDNTVFDRFHVGEMIYPKIYNREGKLSDEDFIKITKRIVDNNDMLIILYASDIKTLEKRLIERGEYDYLDEIKQQNEMFIKYAWILNAFEYKYFYTLDVSHENNYELIDKLIERNFDKKTFNIQYRQLCRDLLEKGHKVEMPNATRGNSYELNNYCFTVNDLDNNVLTLKTRDTSYEYLIGETLWYYFGRRDVEFISKFGKMWKKLTDDGINNNSAYGYIIGFKHNFNQLLKIIELLKKDPNSRRAVINFNVPNENVIETKDEICTICLDFYIRDGKLNCTGVMRSNDIMFGLTYDFTFFTLLQKYIAKELGIPVGSYTHFAMSMHYYEKDVNIIKKIAYGDLETRKENIDFVEFNKFENIKYLQKYVDERWNSKEDFMNKLKEMKIVREF